MPTSSTTSLQIRGNQRNGDVKVLSRPTKAWETWHTSDIPEGHSRGRPLWIREPDASIETQPVVLLGSEGEIEVIARNLGDYLWLLGSGVGPVEAVFGWDRVPEPIPVLVALAQQHTKTPARTAQTVKNAAATLLPALTAFIESSCRYERYAARPADDPR